MDSFTFDPNLSADENIRRFIEHLRTVDAEMAQGFEQCLPLLDPISEARQKREQFNNEIKRFLDSQ